jgi:restriction system protein
MPGADRQRQGEIVRATFAVLLDRPDGMQVREVISEVEKRLPLTEFETADYPSTPGQRRFDKMIRFTTIPAVKAGWLVKSKGDWTLTEDGRTAYQTYTDPAEFMRESVRRYTEWEKARDQSATLEIDVVDDGIDDIAEEVEILSTSVEEADEDAWREISAYLNAMPPFEFQDLVAALLRAMGYHVAWVAPPGPDAGIDIVAFTDPLGAEGPRIKVQVKRHTTNKVGVEGLRSFLAVLAPQDVGIFVCSIGFSPEALREARAEQNRRLTLIDLKHFFELWIEHYDDLTDQDRQRLPLRPVYFLAQPT